MFWHFVCLLNINMTIFEATFPPFGPHEITVLIELALRHMRRHLTDVPLKPKLTSWLCLPWLYLISWVYINHRIKYIKYSLPSLHRLVAGLCFSFQLFLVVAVKMEGVEGWVWSAYPANAQHAQPPLLDRLFLLLLLDDDHSIQHTIQINTAIMAFFVGLLLLLVLALLSSSSSVPVFALVLIHCCYCCY